MKDVEHKVLKSYSISTEKDVYSFYSKVFLKTNEKFSCNKLWETEVKDDKSKLFSYRENFENLSSIFPLFEEIENGKFSIGEKELLNQELVDEDFEEEMEYIIKVKEIYQESYKSN